MRTRLFEVLSTFGKLGVSSFGGPIAHLSYFRAELVERRKWVDEETYADLVALCQFLPGPASSQVGIALGIERAGLLGGVVAWAAFTLPSAIALTLFALGVGALGADAPWIHGLKVVAVPVVALAVQGMAKNLCPDRVRATIAVAAAMLLFAWNTALAQIAVIVGGGLVGWAVYRNEPARPPRSTASPISPRQAIVAWIAFVALLVGLPLVAARTGIGAIDLSARFFRTGALVFGGGHVVLPLLESDVVGTGWTTSETFLAGYGAAQAVPGPLFSFAAYLGAVVSVAPSRPVGALLALVAIYLPSYLLVVGALPFWDRLRASRACQAGLRGTNAAVVGLLAAAFFDPVWTVAIRSKRDAAVALGGWLLLSVWKVPPWLVVAASAAAVPALVRLAS